MFLQAPPDGEAASRLYDSDVQQQGYVMNLSRLWAWRPEICEAFSVLRAQLTTQSSLSSRELAVIVCATASGRGDAYCALAWGPRLASEADPATAAAVLRSAASDTMTARDKALSAWARKVARDPNAATQADIDELRNAGFSEREIFEATVFAAFRVAFSTVNDALGARPDWQLAAAAPPEVIEAIGFGRPPSQPPR